MVEVLQLLRQLGERSQRYCGPYYVRTLEDDEPIPQFGHGIPNSYLISRKWTWLAVSSDTFQPLAILFAAPTLNFVTLLRIYATNTAPRSILLGLFRKSLADIHQRGYTHFIVYLSEDTEVEKGLARLVKRIGGTVMKPVCKVHTGLTDVGKW